MAGTVTSGNALDVQLCFALQSASRAIAASYRPGLEALGLTYSQYTVMLVLWEDGPVTMSALGHRLHLDSGTLSPVLKRLEQQGLVTRRRRPEDERTVEVAATMAGQHLRGPAAEVQARVACDTGLETPDITRLRDELFDLAARLRDTSVPGQG